MSRADELTIVATRRRIVRRTPRGFYCGPGRDGFSYDEWFFFDWEWFWAQVAIAALIQQLLRYSGYDLYTLEEKLWP